MQLKPVLKNIEKQMTRFLREQMGLKNTSMQFKYDDLDILKLAEEEQSAIILAQLKGGLISLNEARESLEYVKITKGTTDSAADNVFMPAYLLGNYPVSYNNFDEDLARLTESGQGERQGEPLPAGNAGGEDNTSVIEDTRGGPQDEPISGV